MPPTEGVLRAIDLVLWLFGSYPGINFSVGLAATLHAMPPSCASSRHRRKVGHDWHFHGDRLSDITSSPPTVLRKASRSRLASGSQ